jgi:hypothetical protein
LDKGPVCGHEPEGLGASISPRANQGRSLSKNVALLERQLVCPPEPLQLLALGACHAIEAFAAILLGLVELQIDRRRAQLTLFRVKIFILRLGAMPEFG